MLIQLSSFLRKGLGECLLSNTCPEPYNWPLFLFIQIDNYILHARWKSGQQTEKSVLSLWKVVHSLFIMIFSADHVLI